VWRRRRVDGKHERLALSLCLKCRRMT
jgi:hypothetical protein